MGPLVAGFITDSDVMGWRWTGSLAAIISGALVVLFYFSLEETFFDRQAVIDGLQIPATTTTCPSFSSRNKEGGRTDTTSNDIESGNRAPKTYWQRIALITPSQTLIGTGFKPYMRRLWLTLCVFSFPAVLYSGLHWGVQDAWLTFYLTIEEDNYYEAPWFYTESAVGIMSIPTLIGATIGCIYGGWFSDVFVKVDDQA